MGNAQNKPKSQESNDATNQTQEADTNNIHSPKKIDKWMEHMESSGEHPNGISSMRKVTRDEVRKHVTKNDCWTILHGKVYDVTTYLSYHPGGESQLMKGAGKDCTSLFNRYHAYVSYESILSKCFVGYIVEGSEALMEEEEEENDD